MQDLLRYAAEHGVSLDTAVAAGMTEKSAEFLAVGGAVYLPPQGTRLGGLTAGIRRMTRQLVGTFSAPAGRWTAGWQSSDRHALIGVTVDPRLSGGPRPIVSHRMDNREIIRADPCSRRHRGRWWRRRGGPRQCHRRRPGRRVAPVTPEGASGRCL
jgi:hypothetical protein